MPPASPRLVVGAMTGTSLDGLDAALVRVEGRGLEQHATVVRHESYPLGELAVPLRAVAEQVPMTALALARLQTAFGAWHGTVLDDFVGNDRVDLACVHGQTVAHDARATWQLLDPAPIAARLDCPVIHDLRRADMAAGGRGAPLTPLADWILYRDCDSAQAIINLGGFANVTWLPARSTASALDRIDGFDVCARNQVLDAVARRALGAAFDDEGGAARAGSVHDDAHRELVARLGAQAAQGRALGTGDELTPWIETHLDRMPGRDLAATATDSIARVVVGALGARSRPPGRIVLAGGGVRNLALVRAIERNADAQWAPAVPVMSADVTTCGSTAREAAAMAVLGAFALDGQAISLPQVTGCRRPAPRGGIVCPPPTARVF